MGWASGTDVFDSVVDAVIEYIPINKVEEVMEKIATPLWDGDWDTENESKYYDAYLVHIMYRKGFIEEDEYRQYL